MEILQWTPLRACTQLPQLNILILPNCIDIRIWLMALLIVNTQTLKYYTLLFFMGNIIHIPQVKFSLKVNREESRLYVLVQRDDGTIDESVYYSFDNIQKCLS